MVYTAADILDLLVLELDPLNIHLFLISTSQKGAFHQIVKKSQSLLLYSIKNVFIFF
jgi:hypothetical protein